MSDATLKEDFDALLAKHHLTDAFFAAYGTIGEEQIDVMQIRGTQLVLLAHTARAFAEATHQITTQRIALIFMRDQDPQKGNLQ